MTFLVVEPTVVTAGMVLANSLPELYPVWTPGATFADGARAVSTDGLSLYESLQPGNTNHDPAADDPDAPVWWARVGASNRWAVFDGEISLAAKASGSFSITLQPGPFTALGLHGMRDISGLRIQVVDASTGATVRDTSHDLFSEAIDTALEFFYTWPRPTAVQKIFTGLPLISDPVLTLTFSGGPAMRIGEIVLGPAYELGNTIAGSTLGLADYSAQERDRWGRLTLEPGDFSRTGSFSFLFDAARLAKVHALLSRVRGKAFLYVPSVVPGYEPMGTLGICTRMRIDPRTTHKYVGSVDLEGLSESI